jgi:ABC-type Fe3+/spermidine/putrescine transport system ATPase subunit
VAAGEIVCLLGPSGCGKTTLLRIVAGLEQPDRGVVQLDGRNLVYTPVHERNFGFMFQEFALFPHRTVGENIAFGLRMARRSPGEIARRVDEMLSLVSLSGYAQRSVFELSGGERQRVALARSLAPSPRLLMLDEPLGSLDRVLREDLMNELRAILKGVGVTALYVTHDQTEAFAVGDRIVVMNRGAIEQVDTPLGVYNQPANEFVARFLGFTNLLPVEVRPEARLALDTPVGKLCWPANREPPLPGAYMLLIRPQALVVLAPATERLEQDNVLAGELRTCSFRGSHYHVVVNIAPQDAILRHNQGVRQFRFELRNEPHVMQEIAVERMASLIGQQVQIMLDAEMMTLL